MLRKTLLVAALLAGSCGSALAGDATSWTGFYLGLNGGYGGDKFDYPFAADFTAGMTSLTLDGSARLNSSGFLGGAQFGYNYGWDNGWVAGLEADIDASSIKGQLAAGGTIAGALSGSASLSAGSKIDYLGTVRARVGSTIGNNFLIYATGGLAYGGVKSNAGVDVSSGGTTLFNGSISKSSGQTGWTLGAGAEYPVTDRISFKAEYLYVDLGTQTLINTPFSILGGTGNVSLKVKSTANVVRVGFDYKL